MNSILTCRAVRALRLSFLAGSLAMHFAIGAADFEISRQTFRPELPAELVEQWSEDLFQTPDALWVFSDKNSLELFLAESVPDQRLTDEFRALANQPKLDYWLNIPFHDMGAVGQTIVEVRVSPEMWSRIPRRVIRSYYRLRRKWDRKIPGVSLKLTEWGWTPSQAFKQLGIKPEFFELLHHSVIYERGRARLIVNSVTWPALPGFLRRRVIQDILLRHYSSRNGLKCQIKVRPNNLDSVLEAFVRDDRHAELRSQLTTRLADHKAIEVDLADIMPPFVRRILNTYNVVSGANCFNLGFNLANEGKEEIKYTQLAEIENTLIENYRLVRPGEELRSGDILLFYKQYRRYEAVELHHVAMYVTKDIVLTKNGGNRFNPYMFQSYKRNLAEYFKDSKYNLAVFRRPSDGEATYAESTEDTDGKIPAYSTHPQLTYPELDYDVRANMKKRRAALAQWSESWLSMGQGKELEELVRDPKAADTLGEAQALLENYLRLENFPSFLRSVSFVPYASLATQESKLRQLTQKTKLDDDQRDALIWIYTNHRDKFGALIEELARQFQFSLEDHCQASLDRP